MQKICASVVSSTEFAPNRLSLHKTQTIMADKRRYPIGIQTFSEIVEGDYLYVDKTEYVYNLTHQYKYVFLSRPRRFGKSLLVSTFKSYFEGRKELFEGLKAGMLEKDWAKYPVFHFNMSTAKYTDIEDTKNRLNSMICDYELEYGVESYNKDIKGRLQNLFRTAHLKTGKPVVILIDEYDSPMLEVMHDPNKLADFRNLFRSFYSPIKDCDEHIRFAFITGITKFSQLSIFCEINNLKVVSMFNEYDAVCGISKDEALTQLKPQIQGYADANECSFDEAVEMLTRQYDGYHFSKNSRDIFNPFSLLNALNDKELNSYWFASGTPSWLINQLKKFNFKIENLEGAQASITDFDAPTEGMTTAFPLLYQSGYITIKDYEKRQSLFTLAVPNNEVRIGLYKNLIPYYLAPSTQESNVFIAHFGVFLQDDKLDEALHLMRSFISSIPYDYMQEKEKSYHLIFFLIARLLCQFVDSEVKNSAGRSDMVLKTPTHIYVFEFKFQGKLDKALLQIDEKGYLIPYECDGRQIVKVAVNFSTEGHTIDGWAIDRGNGAECVSFSS